MKSLSIMLVMVFAVFIISIPAWGYALQSNNYAFTVGTRTANTLDIHFSLPEYQLENETVNGTTYQKILLQNAGYTSDTGAPELPYLSTMIAIPNHGKVTVGIMNTNQHIINQFLPYPVQDDAIQATGRGFTINQAIYQSGQSFPGESVICSDPQILRDFRIVTLQIQPFAWNSATNSLVVRDQIDLRLNFTDEPGINEFNETLTVSPAFDKIYQALILNYTDFRPNTTLIANTPPRIVIIHGACTDSTFQQTLNDFAFWKRQKGADVRILSTTITGTSNAAIKAYLQGLYNDINTRPDFIVLVGDTSGSFSIPTFSSYGSGDYPYQMLAGDDQLGDCFLGRISAENASQLEVILAKIYAYEKDLDIDNAGYLNRMLVMGDATHNGISTLYLSSYIMELGLVFNPDYTYPIPQAGANLPTFINDAINEGVGFYFSRQYIGLDGWNPTASLTNVNKLTHAVLIAQSSGAFNGGLATTESFIRIGTAQAPTGAVTAIGMEGGDTHTLHNNCLAGGVADAIFARKMRTMGEALLQSKLNMAMIYGNVQPTSVAYFTQLCNLMGDPTVEVYITIPHTFSVDAPDTLALGTPSLDLRVLNENGIAVENACVTISQGNVIRSRSYSNASGDVHLSFSSGLGDSLTIITISKHDYKALQDSIIVDGNGSLVAGVDQYDDDNLGNSIGNGNYAPNSGERLEVTFSVKNTTLYMKFNVHGYVTSNDPNITIIDSLLSFGNIIPGFTSTSISPGLMDISPSCPSETYIRLQLHLTDNSEASYLVPTAILVTDAMLQFVSEQVSDANNQVLDPDETVNLSVTVQNNGYVSVSNVSGQLYTTSTLLTLEDDLAFFGDIAVNGEATCTTDIFQIHGSDALLPGMHIPLRVKLTNPDGFLQWIDFMLDVGVVTVTSPLGPDSYGYVIYDDGDVSYPECPVYQWEGIAPDEGGTGTMLALDDPYSYGEGDDTDAISLADVTLPFTFRFYGVEYDSMTVCTNGFIAMGGTRDACFRNYRLPGAIGPGAMIAPFWDDLMTATGSGVFTLSDSTNHRYIVEWYHMLNGYQQSSQETFQVILYDPAYYPTSLGDGPIKIQYQTFNNVDHGNGSTSHGLYSTIGIQDQYHQRGLEYTFGNNYPVAARPLANERCLYITNAPLQYVNIDDEQIPGVMNNLFANYPNPFNLTTSWVYSLTKSGNVSLKIYNAKGQLIKTLVNDNKVAGMHNIVWRGDDSNGKPVSSGIYLYKLQSGTYSATRKMMMLK